MKLEDDFRQWILSHKTVKQEGATAKSVTQEGTTAVGKDEGDTNGAWNKEEMRKGGFEHRPKVNHFWGHSSKDSIPIEVQKFEVECLLQDKNYQEDTKTEAVRIKRDFQQLTGAKPQEFLSSVGSIVKPVLDKAEKMKRGRVVTEEIMSQTSAFFTQQAKTSKFKSIAELQF